MFRLPLCSSVTFAIMHCHLGVMFYLFDYNWVSNHGGSLLTFPTQSVGSWTGDILILRPPWKTSYKIFPPLRFLQGPEAAAFI